MKGICAILVTCLLVGIAASAALTGSGAEGPGKTALDPTRPETWEPAVEAAQGQLREMAKTLISVASDEKAPNEHRRNAILLLGKIGNKEALAFLIDNVSLSLPLAVIKGDEDMLKSTPCRWALSRGDWRAAQAILVAMDQPRPQMDLMHLAYPLERILFRDVAIAAVKTQLRLKPSDVRRKNLEQLAKFLEQ